MPILLKNPSQPSIILDGSLLSRNHRKNYHINPIKVCRFAIFFVDFVLVWYQLVCNPSSVLIDCVTLPAICGRNYI